VADIVAGLRLLYLLLLWIVWLFHNYAYGANELIVAFSQVLPSSFRCTYHVPFSHLETPTVEPATQRYSRIAGSFLSVDETTGEQVDFYYYLPVESSLGIFVVAVLRFVGQGPYAKLDKKLIIRKRTKSFFVRSDPARQQSCSANKVLCGTLAVVVVGMAQARPMPQDYKSDQNKWYYV
jgi:hypothetical protein